ncbi:MAG: integrating conjugative element protein [Rhodocyclaceae bacterium]|nr:integrating conjugative element protein [Rhodocyclaceae bacterium]
MATLRPRAELLAVLTAFTLAALPAQAAQMPSSRSDLYYRLGGTDPASRAANPSATIVRLGLAGAARLNYSCGKFDFEVSFQNLMSSFAAIGTTVTSAVSAGIAALPMYFFQRAQPGLYELFQTYAKKAEVAIELANKSCEQMESEIKAGKDPYDYYKRLATGEAWKTQAASTVDVVEAKINATQQDGENGFRWIGGIQAAGRGMPAARIVHDTVYAGYNVTLNRPHLAGPAGLPSVRLTKSFPTPSAAATFAADVLGDIEISTCNASGCPAPGGTPGLGLIQKFEHEIPISTTALNTAMAAPVPNDTQLEDASAPGVLISRAVIDALRELPGVEREIAADKLARDVALARTIDKALQVRNLLLTARMIPDVNIAANQEIETKLSELNRYIDDLLFENDVRKKIASNTASVLLGNFEATRRTSTAVSTGRPVDPTTFEGGRVK